MKEDLPSRNVVNLSSAANHGNQAQGQSQYNLIKSKTRYSLIIQRLELPPNPAKEMITKLITVYWDCFTEEVIKGLIIGFAFAIGIGKHTMDVAKNRNMVHKKQRSL